MQQSLPPRVFRSMDMQLNRQNPISTYRSMQDNEQPKKDQYRIWRLIARKLEGEASPIELQELHELLQDNPHIQYSVDILTNLRNTTKGQTGG